MAKLSLVAFAAMVMTTGAAQANCSNATIQGNWTFTVHGNALTPNGAAVARIDGVGIITFDGFGNLVSRTSLSSTVCTRPRTGSTGISAGNTISAPTAPGKRPSISNGQTRTRNLG